MSPAVVVEALRDGADLEALLAIDATSFSRPWTRAMYEDELNAPGRSVILVGRSDAHRVAGYCACWVVADEVHINNVAVLPACRRQGIARTLVAAALDEGRRRGAVRAWLEVRRANRPAQALYASLGFSVVAVRHGYYSAPADDGLVMSADIQSVGSNPAT